MQAEIEGMFDELDHQVRAGRRLGAIQTIRALREKLSGGVSSTEKPQPVSSGDFSKKSKKNK